MPRKIKSDEKHLWLAGHRRASYPRKSFSAKYLCSLGRIAKSFPAQESNHDQRLHLATSLQHGPSPPAIPVPIPHTLCVTQAATVTHSAPYKACRSFSRYTSTITEFHMFQPSHLQFDKLALKAEYQARHGRDVGEFVYAFDIKRREDEDAHHAALSSELPSIDARLSELLRAAGIVQQKFAARREAAYSAVLAIDIEAADAAQLAQATIAALHQKSTDIRREMSAIVIRREAERENRVVSAYNAPGLEAARAGNTIAAAAIAANPRNPGLHRK
jgi:hypothetical protein